MRRTADTRRLLARGLAFEAPASSAAHLPADRTGTFPCAGGSVTWRLRQRGRDLTGEVWLTRPDGSAMSRFATACVLPAPAQAAAVLAGRCATVLQVAAGAAAAVEAARDARRSRAAGA